MDVLIFADTIRSPELRHEVPLAVPDPFLYVERDGARHVVVSSLERPRFEELGGYELHVLEEYGLDELRANGVPGPEILDEIAVRAVRELGVERAAVPAGFPLALADRLRAAGLELVPDRAGFDRRRRVKTPAELEGIRRAQAAAEAGMAAARELLAAARDTGDGLESGGEPLTSERVRGAIVAAFTEHDATGEDFIVSHGPQTAIGHHPGEGRLHAGEPIVIDLWPRDVASSCSADMTRTFVVGEVPERIAEWHRLCGEALEVARSRIRPGVAAREVYDAVCDVFEAAGEPTVRTKEPGKTLEDGFYHALGHGVGLDVHEEPVLGISGHGELLAGEVLAIEPGLCRAGYGGVRLEDLVLVTEDGAETLTRFPYDLAP